MSTPHPLPDLFRCADGSRVQAPVDWQRRRREVLDAVLDLEYGRLPPAPAETRLEELHTHTVARFGEARHSTCRVRTGPGLQVSFALDLLVPPGAGPFPVVINGDACWRYLTDEITSAILARGCIVAAFNRTELAPDNGSPARDTGLYRAYPDGDYGALAAWAWGYHRVVDALLTLPGVDPARIAAVGHSRGGKASLLAGATDERIALTGANNSGCGGAGSFHRPGERCERLRDILTAFPYWFSPRLRAYIDRDAELPFDQHFVKALVAPRALLTTEALGDLWANPSGTWHTHAAAAELYRFLGAPDRIGIWYREGGHAHGLADWTAFLDFMDLQFRGRTPPVRYDVCPFA